MQIHVSFSVPDIETQQMLLDTVYKIAEGEKIKLTSVTLIPQ